MSGLNSQRERRWQASMASTWERTLFWAFHIFTTWLISSLRAPLRYAPILGASRSETCRVNIGGLFPGYQACKWVQMKGRWIIAMLFLTNVWIITSCLYLLLGCSFVVFLGGNLLLEDMLLHRDIPYINKAVSDTLMVCFSNTRCRSLFIHSVFFLHPMYAEHWTIWRYAIASRCFVFNGNGLLLDQWRGYVLVEG